MAESDLHGSIHGLKGFLGLLEESVDDRITEVMVARLVHLENLPEGRHVHRRPQVELNIVVTRGLRLATC